MDVRDKLSGWILLLFFFFSGSIQAFPISYIPQVVNYPVSEYNAGNQNWAVAQDSSGILYFGNNRGLLQFDGIRWTLYKLPNNIAVRSLYIAADGRIYAGSFEEFGYFESDSTCRLVYHSLTGKLKDYTFFNDEIWTIHAYRGKIYFQSFSSFFIYDGETVVKGEGKETPLYFFKVNDQLYAQFINGDFARREGDRFKSIVSREAVNNDDVVAALPYDDRLLLVTATNGLYFYDGRTVHPWEIPASDLLKAGIANRATLLNDSSYVIGTISSGLIALDKSGRMLWHINRENHLMNNTVLGLATDRDNNLWVAMDNGIARVEVNSPIYFYEPLEAQIGMVHDMAIVGEDIYLASNQGVYRLSDDRLPQLVPGTKEQTWFIASIDNQLIAGHNKGTLLIDNRQAERIPGPNGGGTALRKCVIHGREILLQSSYTVLSVFTRNRQGRWQFSHNIEGFQNLIKSFEVDPAGTIWASHMYKGVYRLRLDETLRRVKDVTFIGRLEETHNESTVNVMKLRGRIVLTDGNRFYTYEDLSGQIVPYDLLNRDYPELGDTYRIVPVNNDLFWFIRNTEYVLLGYEEGRFVSCIRIPFSLFDNPTIEDRGNIYIGKDGASYFCLNGGIARYMPSRFSGDLHPAALTLSSVTAYSPKGASSLRLPCRNMSANVSGTEISLSPHYNTLSFAFSYPAYSGRRLHIFYKLEGFDAEWQEGKADFTKTYSNLPSRRFRMQAVVRDDLGKELALVSYPFEIERPFYLSAWAFLLYGFGCILLLGVGIHYYVSWELARKNKAAEREKQRREEQLKAQEQLIVKLKNEKLETELTYKSKELAGATLSLINHNDFLEGLKKEIQTQQVSGGYSKRFFDKLIRMIDENLTGADEWAIFQTNFDRIHEQFFRNLKAQYPDLTPGDLRLCALLRLNMPTKDMARMQNLSVRGVEAARYRLRKKLNLPEGQSLVDFMIRFR